MQDQVFTLHHPGKKVTLPQQVIVQLKSLHPRYKTRLTFFGGHPVSMTRTSCNSIFNPSTLTQDKKSPYLVCQKTDGVRYILIITRDTHYFVSRQGSYSIVSYEANCDIQKGWPTPKAMENPKFEHIVAILDGELIKDNQQKENCKIRFLIFDMLVHLGWQITNRPLKERLDCLNKFITANELQRQLFKSLGKDSSPSPNHPENLIEVKIKDFFRLTISKFNATQFLLREYIKCLPHENDGLIFNSEQKQYEFGVNEGYVKWKPPHLNTLDFFVVPNTKLMTTFGRKVVDLYLGKIDEDSGVYTRAFYNFTVVQQSSFDEILKLTESKKEETTKQEQGINYFVGVIAECSFKDTDSEQRDIFKQLLSLQKEPEQILDAVMRSMNTDDDLAVVKQLQKTIYVKCWRINKTRKDKNLPNNFQVARKIEDSIKDNINDQELIKRNQELLAKAQPN